MINLNINYHKWKINKTKKHYFQKIIKLGIDKL